MWDGQTATFLREFDLLRFDMRGHGGSSVPADSFTLGDAACDVLTLLDHLHIPRAHFCGLSLGGMIGQWLAVHAPKRFDRFVLCNTAAKIGTTASWNERIDRVTSEGMEAIVPAVLERWFTPHFRSEHAAEIEHTARMLLATDPHGYVLTCAAIRDMDLRADVAAIPLEVLVVYGIHDSVTPAADAEFLLGQIPNSQGLALQAAHLSNVEAAEKFSAGVLAFLQSNSGGKSHG